MRQTVSRPKDATQSTTSSLAVPHKYGTDPGPHHIQAVALYRHYCPWTHCWRKWNAAEARVRLVLLHLSAVKFFLNCAQRTNAVIGDTKGHPIYGAPTAHEQLHKRIEWCCGKTSAHEELQKKDMDHERFPGTAWRAKETSVSFIAQRSKSNRSMYTNKIIYSLHRLFKWKYTEYLIR